MNHLKRVSRSAPSLLRSTFPLLAFCLTYRKFKPILLTKVKLGVSKLHFSLSDCGEAASVIESVGTEEYTPESLAESALVAVEEAYL